MSLSPETELPYLSKDVLAGGECRLSHGDGKQLDIKAEVEGVVCPVRRPIWSLMLF